MFKSILDNDLYKFTMQNAVCKLYPWAETLYRFTDRNDRVYPSGFGAALAERAKEMATLALTPEEEKFLRERCYFLDPAYLDFLKGYRFDPKEIEISQHEGRLALTIRGPWYRTILWEVPLLAMISELYYEMSGESPEAPATVRLKTMEKAQALAAAGAPFSDFGTRRRFSSDNHRRVMETLKENSGDFLLGTSNVHLAREFDLSPIGTMAHEWIMFHAAINGYLSANRTGFARWVDVYRGEVGIALSDTYTTEVFLKDFDVLPAKLFDGVRQDSGDPVAFARRMIDHYRRLRIDPTAKTIVFSDSLDVAKVREIRSFCDGRIRDVYGIGTHLTNDVGLSALNIVIKLSACKLDGCSPWLNTVKLSDDPGKHTGEAETVRTCLAALESRRQKPVPDPK